MKNLVKTVEMVTTDCSKCDHGIDNGIEEMIYFISDTHFDHTNIIKYENRPFDSVTEMNNKMIEGWNSVVTDNDDIYHLGDVAFQNKCAIDTLFDKLNGRKHIILGNHDKTRGFQHPSVYTVAQSLSVELDAIRFYLSHKPCDTWPGKDDGVIHLHGHIHSKQLPYVSNRFNVSTEVLKYMPISIHNLMMMI